MALPYPKVHVIINPAAGQDEPILNVLNDVFHPAGVAWEISLTHKSGDATRLAAEAAAAGVDLVAAYGGDGTQMEVANGLLGTGVPGDSTGWHGQRDGARTQSAHQLAAGGRINRQQPPAPRR